MISIKSDILTYTFPHHVNVIGGFQNLGTDSCKYKTALFTQLRDADGQGNVVSNLKLVFIDNADLLSELSVSSDRCYILDEVNLTPKYFDAFFQKLREVSGYAIFIGRLRLKQLDYSVGAIYVLKTETPPFEISPAFIGGATAAENFDGIFTEDSELVSKKYSEILGKNVVPVNGKNNFYKYIKNYSKPLLIADDAKFGPIILGLIERLGGKSIKFLGLFVPACFEEFLLSSNCSDQDILDHVNFGTVIPAFDAEAYCEELVKSFCLSFDKSDIAEYFACMDSHKLCEECLIDLRNSKIIKLLKEMIDRQEYSFSGAINICYIIQINSNSEMKKIKANTISKFDFKNLTAFSTTDSSKKEV